MKHDITNEIDDMFIHNSRDLASDIYSYISDNIDSLLEPDLQPVNNPYFDFIGGCDTECDCWTLDCFGNAEGIDFTFVIDPDKFGFDINVVYNDIKTICEAETIKRYGYQVYENWRHNRYVSNDKIYYYIRLGLLPEIFDDKILISAEWGDVK